MPVGRIVFSLILSIAALVCATAQGRADPVLIKLSLEKPSHWSDAREAGIIAYHRFDNSVLAEFERARLVEVDGLGLEYQIIDEEPWTEEYFLASPAHGVAEVNLEFYGRVLLKDAKWQLIKTSRERAFELLEKGYKVIPIRHRPIPLEYRPPVEIARPALKYSADIDSLLNLVSEDSLYTWVLRLQNFQTRYSYSDSVRKARDWLHDKLLSFGIDSLWLHYYYWDSQQWNVVAAVEGTVRPDRVVVVGGHYDSIVRGTDTDPYVWAPGADDNATGTAATLEVARIIAENPLPFTVLFVPFAQEEQGLVGSDHFAEYLWSQNSNLELMINWDMIAHSVDEDPDVVIYGNTGAMDFVDIMIQMAQTYTYLNPSYQDQPFGSDYYSFWVWGFDAIGAAEGDLHSAGWHTNYDVIDSLNFPYYREVAKMGLATLLFLSNFPSSVESLQAVDAGDGHTIRLSWLPNHPSEEVVYYNVHFGTVSGEYDSLHQVYGTADTLRNLEDGTTYFMKVVAINADGYASIVNEEVSLAPRGVPLAPAGLVANPFGRDEIKLDWNPNQEADFDCYSVYRSEECGSPYQLLSGACRETTFVDSMLEWEALYYCYALTAVDTSGNESEMCSPVEGYAVTLDHGIVVVDETYENIAYNMVDSDSIDAFYHRALQDYTYAYVDHSCPNCYPQNQLRIWELVRYSVAIIHSEDLRGNRSLGAHNDSTYQTLKKYLDHGGKVIIEGRRNLSRGDDGDWNLRYFAPGDVPYDYLKVRSAYVPPWVPDLRTEEFIGAFSQVPGYSDLQADSLRVAQCACGLKTVGRVPGVGYVDNLIAGEVIYTFNSAFPNSDCQGKPVAFRYLGDDFKVIFFDFPLYFIQESQATALLHKALSDLAIFTYVCGDCNGDAVVSPGDVVYLINYLFRNGSPPQPVETGDVNMDGEVDMSDAVYLLNYLFRSGNPPCEPDYQIFAKTESASAEVSLRSGQTEDGETSVFVDAEFDTDVSGAQFELRWNLEKFELEGILRTARTKKVGLYHNNTPDGELRVGIVDISGKEFIASGSGPLLQLTMTSSPGVFDLSSLEIKEAILVDVAGRKLDVNIVDKLGKSNLPKEFSLSQNYPNPFNPYTAIEYALPRDCEVKITIYNILGQRVKTLVQEHQKAGHKRIEWDGRDGRGEELATGIYFYRIEAEQFVQTKKMLLLK
ncbi:MAG: M20/M25/M40 family metallo-hydrolase [candidate division Zixibacteria bacterium]|nr:M20/M25/M40 family metallo-hydrolase [candidate division Zixibacteria bacterium]